MNLRKFTSLATLALLVLAFSFTAYTQTATGPKDFGFTFATDYNKWTFRSTGSIASGASIVTIYADAYGVTPSGRQFFPLNTNAPLLIDNESANAETVTPSAVSCTQNSLSSTCTFSATFSNAHTGNFTIRSGTYGIQEAINDILTVSTGGTVVVANGFGGTTTTINTTVAGGNNTTSVLDVRAGAYQFYTWGGSAYAKSASPFNTTTSPGATVTTATGTTQFYCGQAQSTNHCISNLALGTNTTGATSDYLKTRTTNADGRATTALVTGDDIGLLRFWGADGANYIESANIEAKSTGTVASTRVPSQLIFKTGTDAAPTVLTTALTLGADQSATFAGTIVGATTRNSATALDATVTAAAVSPVSFAAATGSANAQAALAQLGANTAGIQEDYFKTRATTAAAAATTTVVTGDTIVQKRFFGADGANYVEAARIEANTAGTIASTRVGGNLKFYTGTDAAPTVLTAALTLDQTQNALVGNQTLLGANKTTITGGSTSPVLYGPTIATGIPQYVFMAANVSTTDANDKALTGLSWTIPANVAVNYPFHCELTFNEATAATANAFDIITATNAPTNGTLWGSSTITSTYTGAIRTVTKAYSATSSTPIITVTPTANGTDEIVILEGFIEQPSSGTSSAVTLNVKTTSGGTDITTVARDSWCRLF